MDNSEVEQKERIKSILNRVNALGGVLSSPNNINSTQAKDYSLEKRFDVLESSIRSKSLDSSSLGAAEWEECEKMYKDLAPSSSALTMSAGMSNANDAILGNSNSKNAPIMYRRQEVLSCADDFKRNIDVLQQIQGLPVPVTKILEADNNSLKISDEDHARLKAVEERIEDIAKRAHNISDRVDTLLTAYHDIILTASEKLVLYDEALASE